MGSCARPGAARTIGSPGCPARGPEKGPRLALSTEPSLPPPPHPATRQADRWRRGSPRADRTPRRVRLELLRRDGGRPGRGGSGVLDPLRRRRRQARRRPEDGDARSRPLPHAEERPLLAAAAGPADTGIPHPELRKRSSAVAGPERRHLHLLALLGGPRALTRRAGTARHLTAGVRLSVRQGRSTGRDRDGHDRLLQGARVPERAGTARRRACGHLSRGHLPAQRRRTGARHGRPPRRDRQRIRLSRRRRHHARRAGSGEGGRLLQARRRGAVRNAGPPLCRAHGRGGRHGSLRARRGALGRARGEHLARPLDDVARPRRGLAHGRLAEYLGRRPARL